MSKTCRQGVSWRCLEDQQILAGLINIKHAAYNAHIEARSSLLCEKTSTTDRPLVNDLQMQIYKFHFAFYREEITLPNTFSQQAKALHSVLLLCSTSCWIHSMLFSSEDKFPNHTSTIVWWVIIILLANVWLGREK